MRERLRSQSATLLILAACITPTSVWADGPQAYESNPEVYSQRGVVNGCGISFTVVWMADGQHITGVSGSTNFFYDPDKRGAFTALKATGIWDGAKTPMDYAWIETTSYGKTTAFKGSPGEDPASYLAVNYGDVLAATIPIEMATRGFTLGVIYRGQPLDSSVTVPASAASVADGVNRCMSSLRDHMQSDLKK